MPWRELFSYEAETGRLIWKVERPGRFSVIGREAGSIKTDGRYRSVCVGNKRFYVHRIVWEMHNGKINNGLCIDHIDGNGLNNRIENLRLVSLSFNQRNRRRTKTNMTGIDGVSKHKNGFSIYCAGKYVKHTADFFEACCIRKSAEASNNYHINHGTERK